MFRTEFYRAFCSRSFLLALLIAGAALAFGLNDYGMYAGSIPDSAPQFLFNAYDAVVRTQNTIIALFIPIIAVLPFADSLALDRSSGYLRSVLMRTSYKQYLSAKLFACTLSGGLAVAGPIIILFGITNLLYPRGLNLNEATQIVISAPEALGPFGTLYRTTPDLYIMALVFTCFIGGASYALLGLAVATITDNRYLVLATPLLLYHLASYTIANLGFSRWLPYSAFAPQVVIGVTWVHVFPTLAAIALGSLAVFIGLAPRAKAQA
jgi:hypothetical protein